MIPNRRSRFPDIPILSTSCQMLLVSGKVEMLVHTGLDNCTIPAPEIAVDAQHGV